MKSGASLRWRLALRSGVPFALLMAGFDLIQGETLALAGLRGLLAGVFFGVAMSLFDARYLQRDASVMTRAARRGLSVPER